MHLTELLADRLAAVLAEDGWEPLPRTEDDVVAFAAAGPGGLDYGLTIGFAENEYSVRANPSLGVRHPETSRLSAVFSGLTPRARGGVALVGTSLLELLPEGERRLATFTRWSTRSVDDVEETVAALRRDVSTYGRPFLGGYSTLDDCITTLQRTERYSAQNRLLAIALALSGRLTEALPVLQELAVEARGMEGPAAAQWQGFRQAFAEHFGVDEAVLGARS